MNGRRYQVRGLLGEGAFGAVYLAQSVGTGLQRDVAIKVLHRDRSTSPAIVGRLRDEARMLALIRHRAIVRVDDLVELDGSWSIVMEYVEGCDVAALLRRGPLPPAVALAIAEEVANALHAASHQPGPDGQPLRLIHRDIKPSNVRLTAQGEVKLLDFGVARADFAEREAGTTQSAFGTLIYMSPERFEGKDSHAADVYALGVSLFEMLTGVSPGKIATDPGRQPPGGRVAKQWAALASMSTELHALLAAMMAYEPGQRPTARDCARAFADLRAVLRGERLEDWAARVVPEVAAEGRVASRADSRTGTLLVEGAGRPPAPPRSSWRWLAGGVLVGVALLGAVGFGGVLAWRALREPRADAPAAAPPPPATPLATALAPRGAGSVGEPLVPPGGAPPEGALPSAPGMPGGDRGGVEGGARSARGESDPSAARGGGDKPPSERSPPPEAGGEPAVRGAEAPLPQEHETRKTPVRAAAKPAPALGEVRLAGDPARVTFEGAPGRFLDPREVPGGTYTATVAFPGGEEVTIRNVAVRAGGVTTFTCSASFSNCTAKLE